AIWTDQHFEEQFALQFGLSGFLGVSRFRTINATDRGGYICVRTVLITFTCSAATAISHGVSVAITETVAVAAAGGICVRVHPGKTEICDYWYICRRVCVKKLLEELARPDGRCGSDEEEQEVWKSREPSCRNA